MADKKAWLQLKYQNYHNGKEQNIFSVLSL